MRPSKAALALASEFSDETTRAYLAAVASAPKATGPYGFFARYNEAVGSLPRSFTQSNLTKHLLASILTEPCEDRERAGRRLLVATMLAIAIETEYCIDDDLLWFNGRVDLIMESSPQFANRIARVICSDRRCRQMAFVVGKTNAEGRPASVFILETDIESEPLVATIEQFLCGRDPKRIIEASPFCKEFSASLGDAAPKSELELDANTLDLQMRHFEGQKNMLRLVSKFYYWCARRRPDELPMFFPGDEVSIDFLCNRKFIELYPKGYRAVLLNPEDPVPKADKWVLYPNGVEKRVLAAKPNKGHCVNASLGNPTLQESLKQWLWQQEVAPVTMVSKARSVRGFIDEVLSEAPALTKGRDRVPIVTTLSATKYLAKVSRRKVSPKLLSQEMSCASAFASYAEKAGVLSVEPAVYLLLDGYTGKNTPKEAAAAGKDDLAALRRKLACDAEKSLVDRLLYIVFCLMCLTPLRINEILDLKVNSVEEMGRSGLFSLSGTSKTSGYGVRRIQIVPQAKSLIDSAIALTEPIRSNSTESMKPYVFLMEPWRGPSSCISVELFGRHLRNQCAELGIPAIMPRNIRKRYETDVNLRGIAKGFTQAELRAIDPHASRTVVDAHYIRPDTREYLLAVTGIEFGTSGIGGSVECETAVGNDRDLVENGCGWCRKDECRVQAAVSCLMCKGFWTTPAHIPEFYALIAAVDAKVADCASVHEKDTLVAVKRLAVGYLALLIERKDTDNGAINSR